MQNKKILVLGLGNEILSDDGIGPRLVKSLSHKIDDPDVIFASAGCGGLELMEYIRGYKKAVLIDAIRTGTGEPGTVYSFSPSDFIETSNLSNLHDINFLTALHIGNILELDLPSELNIIAVEIVEDLQFSEKLTPVMEAKYPQILEEVFAIVRQMVF
jgi:hydrogenase maturation protease